MSEPMTEAGRRLSDEANDWDYFGDESGPSLVDYVDAIETQAVAAERQRMRDAVEGIDPGTGPLVPRECDCHRGEMRPAREWHEIKAAVLAIIAADPAADSLATITHNPEHDLRRWTATAIVATGDVKAAQTVLGHVSAALTTDTYASPTDEGLRRAAGALEEALG